MISAASRDHIVACIDKAEAAGGKTLVDGRGWAKRHPGTWVGPTVILKASAAAAAGESEEIFGPVLMVVKVGRRVANWVRLKKLCFFPPKRAGILPELLSRPELGEGARFQLFGAAVQCFGSLGVVQVQLQETRVPIVVIAPMRRWSLVRVGSGNCCLLVLRALLFLAMAMPLFPFFPLLLSDPLSLLLLPPLLLRCTSGGHVAGGPCGRERLPFWQRGLHLHHLRGGGGFLPDPLHGGHDR